MNIKAKHLSMILNIKFEYKQHLYALVYFSKDVRGIIVTSANSIPHSFNSSNTNI